MFSSGVSRLSWARSISFRMEGLFCSKSFMSSSSSLYQGLSALSDILISVCSCFICFSTCLLTSFFISEMALVGLMWLGSSFGVLLYHLGAFSGEDLGVTVPENIFFRLLGSLSSEVAGMLFSGLEVLLSQGNSFSLLRPPSPTPASPTFAS